jgi:hypothetical protein
MMMMLSDDDERWRWSLRSNRRQRIEEGTPIEVTMIDLVVLMNMIINQWRRMNQYLYQEVSKHQGLVN